MRPVGFGPEGCEFIAPVSLALVVRRLDEDALSTGDIVHRRHEQQSQIVSRLEVRARGPFPCVRHGAAAFKLGTAFLVHQPGSIVGEVGHGISRRPKPLRFKECRPSRAEPPHHVVDAGAGRDQFRLRRAFQVRTTKPEAALEAAILIQDDTRRHQGRPRQVVGQSVRLLAIFSKVQHFR